MVLLKTEAFFGEKFPIGTFIFKNAQYLNDLYMTFLGFYAIK